MLIAGAIPKLERWRPARLIMAGNELLVALLLAASALGAYRSLEENQRWIVLGIYALLAAWVLRASFEHLRRKGVKS